MEDKILEIKEKFYKIKKRGWIKSDSNNTGSIGNLFEKLMDIQRNELEIPDFNIFEIKTKTEYSDSHTTLFSCTPTGPHYHEVDRLKELYGYPDSKFKEFKVLNTIINSKFKNKVGLNYSFQLKIDKEKKKIFLLIYNKAGNLIENSVYWDFDILKEKLYRKLKYLAYVKAFKNKINNTKYFKYFEMKIYMLKDFETFITLLNEGIIKISLKIGIYRDEKRKGKIHDHGTSFGIQENDLDKLYNLLYTYK